MRGLKPYVITYWVLLFIYALKRDLNTHKLKENPNIGKKHLGNRGGKKRGLGPNNDALTTCKAINKGKEKQPFRSNYAAFIIASRTVYARIKCQQTTKFKLLKLLQ